METNNGRSNFKAYVDSFIAKKKNFHIHRKRGNESMHVNDNTVAIYKSGKRKKNKQLDKEVVNLIANVSKNINNFCVKNQFDFEIEKERHTSIWSNHDLFFELDEGEIFYYIDIKHCFWRIAFLKGYISENMYKSILEKPHLKTYRNMALACIVAPASRDYYVNGEKVLGIEEDKTMHRLIYDNIRFTCYNLMGDIAAAVGEKYVIGYRTDGIMVLPEKKDEVISLIKEQDFMCTDKRIIKVDDSYYKYENGTLKHF